MKNLIKLKVILLAISVIFASESFAKDSILPKPKPSVDQEIKQKTEKSKGIYPKEKPIQNEEIKEVQKSEDAFDSMNQIGSDEV